MAGPLRDTGRTITPAAAELLVDDLRTAVIADEAGNVSEMTLDRLQQTRSMPNAVARALEDRHILRAEHRRGIRWYELAHDRLIRPISRADSPEAYLRAARAALAGRKWEQARRLADEAVRASDLGESWVRAEAAEIFADVAVANGEIETARRHCEEAAVLYAERQRFDGVARVLRIDGLLWLEQGDHAKAIERRWRPSPPRRSSGRA